MMNIFLLHAGTQGVGNDQPQLLSKTIDAKSQFSRFMPSFAYLEHHCSLFIRVRSKTCLWSVATLLSSYFCTRTLAIGSCKSEKRAADAAIHFRPSIILQIHELK